MIRRYEEIEKKYGLPEEFAVVLLSALNSGNNKLHDHDLLGLRARDIVTGIQGTIVGFSYRLEYDNPLYLIQPKSSDGHSVHASVWSYEKNLEIL